MSASFNILLSRPLGEAEIVAALRDLLPDESTIDVAAKMSELPDEPRSIWALVETSEDPNWPCVFNCMVCRDECGLGTYPDLKIAVQLYRRLGVDAVCGVYDFAGVDSCDPYWQLAHIGGRWFLASLGTEAIRLERPIDIPAEALD
jgi:hypothetical protein